MELNYKKKRDFVYNIILKALDEVINAKNTFIPNNKDLLDCLNKLVFKKIIKKLKAKIKQFKGFFKGMEVIIN